MFNVANRLPLSRGLCLGGIALFMALLSGPALAAETLTRTHKGIALVAPAVEPGKTFDTSLLPQSEGLDKIAKALDLLVAKSPLSARALKTLKKHGRVVLVYIPDDLRSPSGGGGVTLALYVPEYLRVPGKNGRKKSYNVLIGRHGIKWPASELASVLAHELLGHGLQDHYGRLKTMRVLDLECEAYLHEEIANQDLGLDKFSREMIAFRKGLEEHWCSEFKTFMRKHRPGETALWDELNPDVPKLLKAFDAYLKHISQRGVTGKAIATNAQQVREKIGEALENASPDKLFKAAITLRDGGLGVRPDVQAAFKYFKNAAELGHVDAMLDTARMYENGTGVAKDAGAAMKWFGRAAEKGNAAAQTYIGWRNLQGRGVAQDYEAAFRWFTKAAAQGETQANYYLATMLRRGLGRDKDHAAAAAHYRKAVKSGHTESQYRLGRYLYRGIGVEKDLAEAADLITRAAEKGHAKSQNNLGWMYTKGNGVARNPDVAADWFAKAAAQGYADAQVRLGWLHVKGIGVEKDFASAYVWYALAAADGHDKAVKSRDLIAGRLSPTALDAAKRRIDTFSLNK